MTKKKQNILNAALELFAKEGFKITSTKKVAVRAGVSEGLIFRHFTNKNGLLQAVLLEGDERAKSLFGDVVTEPDPKEVIRKTIELSTTINEAEAEFWKLQYKIKWELEEYGGHKMEPLRISLVNAFRELGYIDPDQEAQFLISTIDGMTTRFYLDRTFDIEDLMSYMKVKYKL